MKIKFREKIILFIAVLVIILTAYFMFFYFPYKNTLSDLEKEWEDQRINLVIAQNKSENLSALANDDEEILKQEKTLNKMILSEDKQLNLFKDMEKLALDNKLTQSYNLETADASRDEINIRIDLSGNYTDVIRYLSGLEALDYYVKTNSLDLNSSLGQDLVSAHILTTTYWQ